VLNDPANANDPSGLVATSCGMPDGRGGNAACSELDVAYQQYANNQAANFWQNLADNGGVDGGNIAALSGGSVQVSITSTTFNGQTDTSVKVSGVVPVEPITEIANLRVSIYDGAMGFGHAGIGVNSNQTCGLYPSTKPSCLILGCAVRGTVNRDDNAHRLKTVVIKTTPDQDRKANDLIRKALQNPPSYNLYGNNCAQFVESILNQVGVRVPSTEFPLDLNQALSPHSAGQAIQCQP